MPHDVIAIVVAGGRSRRMGALAPRGGKAALPVGNDTMLARVCRALTGEVGRVIVVAAKGQPLPPLDDTVEVTRDTEPDCGPLAAIRDGIAHALATGPRPAIAVLCSCDVPELSSGVVRFLIETARASGASWVMPIVGGHPQILVSAVTASAFGRIMAEATSPQERKSPRAVLDAIRAEDSTRVLFLSESELVAIDPGLASFADIDTPEDLEKPRFSTA